MEDIGREKHSGHGCLLQFWAVFPFRNKDKMDGTHLKWVKALLAGISARELVLSLGLNNGMPWTAP